MRNGVYCCIIHETNYIVDILCTVIALLNNKINLYMKIGFSKLIQPEAATEVFCKKRCS